MLGHLLALLLQKEFSPMFRQCVSNTFKILYIVLAQLRNDFLELEKIAIAPLLVIDSICR